MSGVAQTLIRSTLNNEQKETTHMNESKNNEKMLANVTEQVLIARRELEV